MQSKDCVPSNVEKRKTNSEVPASIEKVEIWGCSSAGRAPALQAGGQEFDPPHLHHRASEDGSDDRTPKLTWACSSGG